MAHNLDMTHGRANIAFRGSRTDVWHRLGQEMKAGMTAEQWATAAGLEWTAIKVPALADLSGIEFQGARDARKLLPYTEVEGDRYVVRSDTGYALGHVSDRYQPVQPSEVLSWFQRYIAVDERFELDVAGSLKSGKIIWATATFRDPIEVAGDKHVPRVLMTTTFDGTGSTINQATMTRVVCNNTLDVSLCDKRALIRSRHSSKFDAARVGKELAGIASSFDQFKRMGDAMAQQEMRKDDIARMFKSLLDIPFDAPQADVSARKQNQFAELNAAYIATCLEGTPRETKWSALNAVTRYVDHDKSVKNGHGSVDEARFVSAQFGSGASMKAKAVAYLMPDMASTADDAALKNVLASTPLYRN